MRHFEKFFEETVKLAVALSSVVNVDTLDKFVATLNGLTARKGRLFIAGLGGSAANASHAANDFRKLCSIESYALHDNAAEFTARANDEGWPWAYAGMMESSNFCDKDALLVLSVGGGSSGVSAPLIHAVDYAKKKDGIVLGILGRDGGYCGKHADLSIIIPTVEESRVTPHVESFQSVILHALVSHPMLQIRKTKW